MLTLTFNKFKIHFTFGFLFLVAISSAITDNISLYCLLFCLFHEASHLLAMLWFRVKVSQIKFYGSGIKIVSDPLLSLSKLKSATIYFAGCFCNLLLASVMAKTKPDLALINLFLGIFNLLPISYFDGGKLLQNFCELSEITLQRISKITFCVVATLVVLAVFYFKIPLGASAVFTLLFVSLSEYLE